MPVPPPVASRRAVLAGSLATFAVAAGCDLELSRDPVPAPSAGSSSPPPDADAVLVERVVAETTSVLALVEGVRRVDRAAVEALAAMHRAHLPLLGVEPPAPAADAGARRARLARVRAREEGLQQLLAESALAAGSGALARVLASMSAGVAQHLAVLPPEAPR